jgi:hypothetical protein
VSAIDGTKEDADSSWLYYVDGVESPVAASSQRLKPGQVVQWDYHAWQNVRTGKAIVGAYPEPLKSRGAKLVCASPESDACVLTRKALSQSGIALSPSGGVRVVVGPYSEIVGFDGVPDLESPGDENGAYASFSKNDQQLTPVSADGSDGKTLGAGTGLVAAFAEGKSLTWLVTGTDESGTQGAAQLLLGGDDLTDSFAVLSSGDSSSPLPEGL